MSDNELSQTIIYLFGYPGIGKKTIGEALCKKSRAILVDNHSVSNLLRDIAGPLAPERLDAIKETGVEISKTLLDFMAQHCQQNSYVLTSVLYENDPVRKEWFEDFKVWCDGTGWSLFPVKLNCNWDELVKRLEDERRQGLHKLMDRDIAKEIVDRYDLLEPSHANTIELDITDLSADQAAAEILKAVKS